MRVRLGLGGVGGTLFESETGGLVLAKILTKMVTKITVASKVSSVALGGTRGGLRVDGTGLRRRAGGGRRLRTRLRERRMARGATRLLTDSSSE